MPSRRSNGCADALILLATFLEPYYRRSCCPVMPYLLDERSSTRLGSVKNVFRTKFFRRTDRKTPASHDLLQITVSAPDSKFGWFMVPMHAREAEGALHEPPVWSSGFSRSGPPEGGTPYRWRAPDGFMAPRHGRQAQEIFHVIRRNRSKETNMKALLSVLAAALCWSIDAPAADK